MAQTVTKIIPAMCQTEDSKWYNKLSFLCRFIVQLLNKLRTFAEIGYFSYVEKYLTVQNHRHISGSECKYLLAWEVGNVMRNGWLP